MANWHDYAVNGQIAQWPYPIRCSTEQFIQTDVLVLGRGIAGCWAPIGAERWLRRFRCNLLGHAIASNEKHLSRLVAECVRYYHEGRMHLGLEKETFAGRARFAHSFGPQIKCADLARTPRLPTLGNYGWQSCAGESLSGF